MIYSKYGIKRSIVKLTKGYLINPFQRQVMRKYLKMHIWASMQKMPQIATFKEKCLQVRSHIIPPKLCNIFSQGLSPICLFFLVKFDCTTEWASIEEVNLPNTIIGHQKRWVWEVKHKVIWSSIPHSTDNERQQSVLKMAHWNVSFRQKCVAPQKNLSSLRDEMSYRGLLITNRKPPVEVVLCRNTFPIAWLFEALKIYTCILAALLSDQFNTAGKKKKLSLHFFR